MASVRIIGLSQTFNRLMVNSSFICHKCQYIRRYLLPYQRVNLQKRLTYSSNQQDQWTTDDQKMKPSYPNNQDTDSSSSQLNRIENKVKIKKSKVLYNRQLPVTATNEEVEWTEFSKNLATEDTFGTQNTGAVEDMVKRAGISRKSSRSKTSGIQKGTESLQRRGRKTEDKQVKKLRSDDKWTSEFGTMAEDTTDFKEIDLEGKKFADDDGEADSFEQPQKPLAVTGRKHTQNWYGRQIEKLSAKGKIYESIEFLETKMLKEDRVMPNQYVFTTLIGALGRVGYTKKAFKLYNKMKKFGLEPEDPTYTALFNACSNSPWLEDGLQRATKLREQLQEKNIQPNLTTYKAMVKAFGRCGDLQLAFGLVDELNAAGYRVDEEVFAMLLQACVSDKSAGLRYAIEVWRRLKRRKKASPTIFHYNLLLRAIRDCQIGDPVLANLLLQNKSHGAELGANQMLPNKSQDLIADNETCLPDQTVLSIDYGKQDIKYDVTAQNTGSSVTESKSSWWSYQPDGMKSLVDQVQEENNSPQAISILDANVPNILCYSGNFGQVVGLGNLDTKENRLALFGGLPGILKNMETDGVKPDIRTFTQLLELIPSTREAERDLLAAVEAYKVDMDIAILNLLIRKRNLRKDYKGAKDVLSIIAQKSLSPDVMTYGCLAMGCHRKEDGLELFKNMEASAIMPTVYICDILMSQTQMNFSYKLALCQKMESLEIKPNESLLKKLEFRVDKAWKMIVMKEKGKTVPSFYSNPNFDKDFEIFMKFYKRWLLSMNLDVEPHPWEQYRKSTPGNEQQD